MGEVNAEDNFEIKTRYNVTKYPTYMAVYSFGHEPEKLDPVCTDVYSFVVEVDRVERLPNWR